MANKTVHSCLTRSFSVISLWFYAMLPCSMAQGEVEWQTTIGGASFDELQYVEQTADGGYILGGFSVSFISGDKAENPLGGRDYWVVKLDASRAIQWQNTIGGGNDDYLQVIHQTSDGGYILGGHSISNLSGDKTENSQGLSDYWVIKLTATGAIQWQNTIGGSDADILNDLQQTADGGYILGGVSASNISGDKTENRQGTSFNYDYWIVKLNANGNIQWQNTIGGDLHDYLTSLQQTADGGYMVGGHSGSTTSGDKTELSLGYNDYWVVKLNSTGSIEWQNTIGGNDDDLLRSIKQTTDGGYIIGGESWSGFAGDKTSTARGYGDYWVLKLNTTGNIIWQKCLGGTYYDKLYSIRQTTDGGYIVGGDSESPLSNEKSEGIQGGTDYWVLKLDANGGTTWQNTIGGFGYDYLRSVQQTTDGGFILGGYSEAGISGDKNEACEGNKDYWVVKLSATCSPIPLSFTYTQPCYGLSNGSIRANPPTPTGYTYSWNTGAHSRKLSNISANTYTVTMTQTATGCTIANAVLLNNPYAIYITYQNIACYGVNIGSATAMPTNANGQTQYLWSTGSTNVSINNLPSGSYSVTVSGNTCAGVASVEIISPSELTLTHTITATAGNRYRVRLTGSGGTPYQGATPFYKFCKVSNAGTCAATNVRVYNDLLPNTTYEFRVYDYNTCTKSIFVTTPNTYNDPFGDDRDTPHEDDLTIDIHPNPLVDMAQITSDIIGLKTIRLYDALGRLVHTVRMSGEMVALDLSFLPSGIYSVAINGEKGERSVARLVKE